MSATINYAVQVCDSKSFQGQKRFCSNSRTEISQKCLASLFLAIKNCQEQISDLNHNINLVTDNPSDELNEFLLKIIPKFQSEAIKIQISPLTNGGMRNSIEACYNWLDDSGGEFVYQIQDDYLFFPTAIYEIVSIYSKIFQEIGIEPIVSPFNDPWLWLGPYRNQITPRGVFVGERRYWIQFYDMSCSFFTSHNQFRKHWDEYYSFFKLVDENKKEKGLENKSLNYILTRRAVLGIVPVQNLAFHMQSDLEKDPHLDWKSLWDQIKIDY